MSVVRHLHARWAASSALLRLLGASGLDGAPALAAAGGPGRHSTAAPADPGPTPGDDDAVYGGETLASIRSRIFGTAIGDGRPSGRKLLRKKLVGELEAAYYPPEPTALDPLFVDQDDLR